MAFYCKTAAKNAPYRELLPRFVRFMHNRFEVDGEFMTVHKHSLHVKVAVAVGIFVLPPVAWILARKGLFRREKLSPPVIREDVLKRPALEPFAERIPAPDFALQDLAGVPSDFGICAARRRCSISD